MVNTIVTKGILTINGKEIENTWTALRKETQKLKRELKKIPEGTDEFIKKAKELENAEKHFNTVDKKIKNVNVSLNDANEYFSKFIGGLSSGNYSLAQEGLRGISQNIKGITKAGLAFIATPIGWAIAALAGIALATKKWVDFNIQVFEANKNVQEITNTTGEAVDAIRIRSEILNKFFKIDVNESIKSAKSLVESFGISYDEAFDLIQESAVRGKHKNEEFFTSIKEYPTQFQNAGFSAKEFIDVVNAGFDLSIYADKLPDAIKEFTLSVTEKTQPAKEALQNAFGKEFTSNLFSRIKSGAVTPKKALQEIAQEADRIGLNAQQAQLLTADLFKGAGEDAGGALKIFEAVNIALNNQQKPLAENKKLTKQQLELNEELNEIYAQLFASGNKGFSNWIKRGKIFATKTLINILKAGVGIYNWFVDLNNESRVFSGLLTGVGKASTLGFGILSEVLSLLWEQLKTTGTLIEGIFTFDGDKIKSAFVKGFSNIGDALTNLKNKANNDAEDIFKAFKGEAKKQRISLKDLVADETKGVGVKTKNTNTNTIEKETELKKDKSLDNAIKQQEKVNKKLLKLQQKLEDEKMLIKEDSLKKELKLLDIEYRRKKEKYQRENKALKKEIEVTNSKISSLQNKKSKTKSTDKQGYYNKLLKELDFLNKRRAQAKKINDDILIQLESTKQFKIATIKEKWFVKSLEHERKKIDKEKELTIDKINTIASFEEARRKLQDEYGVRDLSKVKTIVDAKNKLRKEANKEALKNEIKFLEKKTRLLKEELKKASGLGAEQLKENLNFLEEKLTKIKGILQGKTDDESQENEKSTDLGDEAGSLDVLGFSAQQWVDTFENLDTTESKLKAVGMAMQGLANAGRMYAKFQERANQRELKSFTKFQERRKKVLKQKLNAGVITQEEYHKEVEKLEKQAANKKAELEYKQAKAAKISNLFEAIGSTAAAVAKALPNIVLAGIVGAMGAVQIGMIASQPLPPKTAYADGGFTKGLGFKDETGHEVAGAVHADEYVVPKWLLEEPQVANVVDWIEAKRTKTTAYFDNGGYTSENEKSTLVGNDTNYTTSRTDTDAILVYQLSRLNDNLEKLERDGLEAFLLADAKNGKLMHDAVKKFKTIHNKNKR